MSVAFTPGTSWLGLVLIRHVLRRPGRYPWGAGGFALYWLLLAYATGYVATALPLPGGGAAGVEASMAVALHLTGVPLWSAVLAVFAYRVVTFWLPIPPALALSPSIPLLTRSSCRPHRVSPSETRRR